MSKTALFILGVLLISSPHLILRTSQYASLPSASYPNKMRDHMQILLKLTNFCTYSFTIYWQLSAV